MTRSITMMSVSDILAKATNSLDLGEVDWWTILANKVSHAHFDELVESIQRDGFTMPIVLVDSGDDEYTIGNGHHRLCAAILLGYSAIPVLINDEGDYWAFEDSHDEEWDAGDRSFSYWSLLQQNMPDGYNGDCHNDIHRAQFQNRVNAECESCGYEDCECCGECESYPCICATPCHHCLADAYYEEDHRVGCQDRESELIYCSGCGYSHYRRNACDHLMSKWHDEAIAEHGDRGFSLPGMWHPEYILTSAYDENARRERSVLIENARAAWMRAIDDVREAVRRDAGPWAMAGYIETADALYREFCAL